MITMNELLMNRAKIEDLPQETQRNLAVLLDKINKVRSAYGKPMKVNSGLRRPQDNDATSNASKASAHLVGMAVDMADADCQLWNWCLKNLQLLKDLGLYLEDKRHTPTWVHFGTRKPASGHRIFVPSTSPAPAPNIWDGKYDIKFD